MKVELIEHTPNPEVLIANAASTCYDSMPKELDKARKMIAAIIKSGHTSVIEHATASFVIECSKCISQQLERHRIGFSYSQRSQRYVNESEPSYEIPEEIENNEAARKVYVEQMASAWQAYRKLQELGLRNEMARYVLPNACTTKVFVTADFRAWRNFLKLRLSKRAQHEIRDMANMILEKLIEIAPSCFEDLRDENNIQNT